MGYTYLLDLCFYCLFYGISRRKVGTQRNKKPFYSESRYKTLRLTNECENLAIEIANFIYEEKITDHIWPPEENMSKSDDAQYQHWRKSVHRGTIMCEKNKNKFGSRLHALNNELETMGNKPNYILTFGDRSCTDVKTGKLI